MTLPLNCGGSLLLLYKQLSCHTSPKVSILLKGRMQAGIQEGVPPGPCSMTKCFVQADEGKQNASAESREVVLRIRWEQMEPQLLLLRVLPGLPRSLRLLPGHPWAPQVRHSGCLQNQIVATQ